MARVHTLPIRIYYEDTDAGGIVYHASYLRFCERGRTELMRDMEYPHNTMIEETGNLFVVRRQEIDYHAPAKLDDLIDIKTSLAKIGKTSIILKQDVVRDNQILIETLVTLVCVNGRGRATRIPPKALEAFERFNTPS